jgi:hypothetical protein
LTVDSPVDLFDHLIIGSDLIEYWPLACDFNVGTSEGQQVVFATCLQMLQATPPGRDWEEFFGQTIITILDV